MTEPTRAAMRAIRAVHQEHLAEFHRSGRGLTRAQQAAIIDREAALREVAAALEAAHDEYFNEREPRGQFDRKFVLACIRDALVKLRGEE